MYSVKCNKSSDVALNLRLTNAPVGSPTGLSIPG
jgi:hypothetical protein